MWGLVIYLVEKVEKNLQKRNPFSSEESTVKNNLFLSQYSTIINKLLCKYIFGADLHLYFAHRKKDMVRSPSTDFITLFDLLSDWTNIDFSYRSNICVYASKRIVLHQTERQIILQFVVLWSLWYDISFVKQCSMSFKRTPTFYIYLCTTNV